MLHSRFSKPSSVLAALLIVAAFILPGCAPSGPRLVNGVEAFVAKGRVTKISLDEGILTVRPRRGDATTVKLTSETKFKGLSAADSIEKKQPLEILYIVEDGAKIAVSVEALPEGGC